MMDWTENERCIFCDKGGKLLVCNNDGCPISVHKDCMDSRFSDIGEFYCPYCLYRQLAIETRQLKDKAILAKKALSNFLGEKHIDGNNHELKPEMANEKEQNLSRNGDTCRIMVVYKAHSDPIVERDVDCVLCEEQRVDGGEIESGICEMVQVEDRVEKGEFKDGGIAEIRSTFEEKAQPSKNVVISSCVEKEPARQKRKRSEALRRTGKGVEKGECKDGGVAEIRSTFEEKSQPSKNVVSSSCGEKEPTRQKRKRSEALRRTGKGVEKGECKDGGVAEIRSTFEEKSQPSKNVVSSSCVEKEPTCQKRKRSEALRRTGKGRTEKCVTNNGAETLESISVPLEPQFESEPHKPREFDRYAKPPLVKGKRRVRWSDEEEDMLKEGVEKFAAKANKNLPWKKVLEFGQHVFDASRTPADLKDKWRNMAK